MMACKLASKCRKAGDPFQCNALCYPYLKLHGEKGVNGVLGLANIPSAYADVTPSTVPFRDANPTAYAAVSAYCVSILENVEKGRGLYLYSIPNPDNPKGTGTGKTTATVAILTEYAIMSVILHTTHKKKAAALPALFVNASKFQNAFNAQFRGTPDMQQEASRAYYELKSRMLSADLLAIDDIGVRDATPAFLGEFYEVIDDRSNLRKATLFSSNVPLSGISTVLDERIESRIEGMAIPISFVGKDMRKGGALRC